MFKTTEERAQIAKNVLELSDFKLLVEEVRKDVFGQWIRTNVNETEKRENLHAVVNGLEQLIATARKYVNDKSFEDARDNQRN